MMQEGGGVRLGVSVSLGAAGVHYQACYHALTQNSDAFFLLLVCLLVCDWKLERGARTRRSDQLRHIYQLDSGLPHGCNTVHISPPQSPPNGAPMSYFTYKEKWKMREI